ncbi:MAG: DUF4340 domain-containing protein [Ruminococcaceae bacterium]|nr:DUF4340 domain-containing protein [Oscillospiraceae bacterium]
MRREDIVINVIFDAGKGRVSTESREAVCGQPLGMLPTPVRNGYRFEGWFLNGEAVTEETVLTVDEDVCLQARWSKKAGVKKVSMYRRQKLSVAVLSIVTVLLIVALVFTNHIVEIYGLTDTYYGDDGEVYTEKYYVRKKQGSYGLYDRDGTLMEKNSEGYFIAKSGNQYSVDPETGEYELYAVVDYDAAGGEILGFSDRIMLFPQITQANTISIEVENEYGGFRFYKNEEGVTVLEGTEDTLAAYDPELYATLCSACGYLLTMQKLDLTSEESTAPRLPDGSIDYEAYGLTERTDGEGKVTYTPASFTITGRHLYDVNGDGKIADSEYVTASYRVMVGDKILSGGGYYIKMEGGKLTADGFEKIVEKREAVYIVSTSLSTCVLQPVEEMVLPMIVYPTSIATHVMAADFLLGRVNLVDLPDNEEEWEDLDISPIAAFTYQDLAERQYTMYTSQPYLSMMDEQLKGYNIRGDSASEVLNLFYQMEFISCVKLGLTTEALAQYGLDGDVHFISYKSPVTDDKNSITGYLQNTLIVSDKTENNTYYVASLQTNMIVEVDQFYFAFLEWEQKQWYEQYIFQHNIAHIQEMNFQFGKETYNFLFDNSESDQSKKDDSRKMKVYCEQFLGGKETPHRLDYEIVYSYITDAGQTKTKKKTAYENFQSIYTRMLYFSLMGDVDAEEFFAHTGMSMQEYIAAHGDATCGTSANGRGLQAIIHYKAEDNAARLNDFVYEDDDGNKIKLYTENNKKEIVFRFYAYSDWKTLLTLEVIEDHDENGNPITDPTKATGAFWVDTTYLDKILTDIHELLDYKLVDDEDAALKGLQYH